MLVQVLEGDSGSSPVLTSLKRRGLEAGVPHKGVGVACPPWVLAEHMGLGTPAERVSSPTPVCSGFADRRGGWWVRNRPEQEAGSGTRRTGRSRNSPMVSRPAHISSITSGEV